ncbi:MAG: PH domain-containing protein [Eudoraea sp.]|uniref:PH domain-containing protein n=1 Tax=Eudoraea sp. TaxID=1979955 RepID=UPI0032651578
MKKYPSKISYGLVVFILAILVGSTIPMISNQIWLGLIINLLVAVFIAHLFFTTYYVIDEGLLIVKSGFLIDKKIDIKAIRSISETNNLISAPAASFDRLEILYHQFDSILISPRDKSGFIDHITRINPQIVVRYISSNTI